MYWRPIINVDKLWSLIPAEEKKKLDKDSEIVPVIDTLRHGYGKVLGNGKLPELPFIVKARYVSALAESVSLLSPIPHWILTAL
jgi:large subunit ribosomal protein L27Ae